MSKSKPIEYSLFRFNGWDGDHECMTYYDCYLVRDIGKYKKDSEIASIVIININSEMEFYDSDGNLMDSFNIKYDIIDEN